MKSKEFTQIHALAKQCFKYPTCEDDRIGSLHYIDEKNTHIIFFRDLGATKTPHPDFMVGKKINSLKDGMFYIIWKE